MGDETRLSFTPEELGHVCEEAGQDALRAADVPELRSQLAAARAEIDRLKGRDFYDAWPSAQVREFGHLAPREFVAAHAAAVREESSDQVDTLAKALRRLLNVTYKWPDVQIAQKLAVEALAAVEKWGE